MAKKTKAGKTPETKPDDARESAAQDTVSDAGEAAADRPSEDAPQQDAAAEKDAAPVAEGAFVLVDPVDESSEDAAADASAETESEPASEPESEVEPAAEYANDPLIPVAPPEPVVVKKGGFVPMLLGGIAAAVIGFGVARYVLPEGWPWPGQQSERDAAIAAQLDAQKAALADMQATIEQQKIPDIAPLATQIEAIQANIETLDGSLTDISQTLDELTQRVTALEAKPVTSAADPDAVAAYERELKQLQEAMASQRAQVEQIAAEAKAKQAAAEAAERAAERRAALGRIAAALDAGDGFAEAAAQLGEAGVTLPPELASAAKTGVPSRAALIESFAPAARTALSKARRNETGGGFTAFLKEQLGARSLEPRQGNDPDAVLSRAEAAVKEGRLGDAITELDALPGDAKAAMASWIASAQTRMDALTALKTLSDDATNENQG